MKKKVILSMLVIASLSLTVGCSSNEDPEDVETTEETSNDVKSEGKNEENNFDGEVAEIEDVKIKITETKVIQPGEEGNEVGEKPVFAIWYEATNKTDKEIDPISAWIAIFDAIQDNDDNMVNQLEVGSLPDENHLDTQMNIIKKDGTVENSIAYELDDGITPVTLKATKGMSGEEIGQHDYKLD